MSLSGTLWPCPGNVMCNWDRSASREMSDVFYGRCEPTIIILLGFADICSGDYSFLSVMGGRDA